MEAGEKVEVGSGESGSGGPGGSRWNPTKEQISLLETLYRQGVRTPSTEQIQQITSRLRAYGHIEGKNVFYWFQNHKARQRQKQKQENLAYFNRLVHHRTPPPHPVLFHPQCPCPNVVCPPHYIQPCEMGYYSRFHSKVLLPGGVKRRPLRIEKSDKTRSYGQGSTGGICSGYEPDFQEGYSNFSVENASLTSLINNSDKETLDLFPIHPTGDLQERLSMVSSPVSSSAEDSISEPSCSSVIKESSGSNYYEFLR